MNNKVKLMTICWLSFLFLISCQNYDKTKTKEETLAKISHKSNLKSIGLNIVKYSFDNDGKMPESLEELFKSLITEKVYGKLGPRMNRYVVKKIAKKIIRMTVDKVWERHRDKLVSKLHALN